MSRTNKRFGWIPDLPDQRDHLYASPYAPNITLPASVDLRSVCPSVYDQGQLGSCTANAIAAALEFDQMKQHLTSIFVPSRLFIYYNERAMEGTVGTDSGAQIRDGIKSVGSQGTCTESEWPYDITKFAVQPPANCYQDAPQNRALSYQRLLHSLDQMRACLASGFPFVFGMTVYESFESAAVAQSGQVPMPAPNEQSIGGHAVLAVGYDDAQQAFLVRNSWGTGWGMQGYFSLPYAYLSNNNLTDDLWTIRIVQ
ncbi:MAG TPA: C1 family peptidase [Ktedonobacteraceae bacterium]|nr:C1 family peptidase [Ktedonobacteraceae bacterium]